MLTTVTGGEICEEFAVTERNCYSENCPENLFTDHQIFDCAFHPSEPILACGLRDGSVRIFRGRHHSQPFADWERDEALCRAGKTRSAVSTLSWNMDGTRLAAGCSDGTVVAWNFPCDCPTAATALPQSSSSFEARRHPMAVFSVIWNRWNRHLFATRSRDEGVKQRVIVWNSPQESCDLIIERVFELDTKFITDFEWVSAVRLAVCSFEGDIHVFNTRELVAVRWLSQPGVRTVCWHSASHLLASSGIDGHVKVWSMKDYAAVDELKWDVPACSIDCFGHRTGCYSLIACGLGDGTILIWCLTSGRAYHLDGHADAVVRVCFSHDGRFLASMDPEEKIAIWSTSDWQIKCEHFKPSEIEWNRMTWSPNSKKLAIANRTERVMVIDVVSEV